MSDPLWPEHWSSPEDLKHNLMRQEFSEEEADALIESLHQFLRGEGVTLREAEESDE